MQRDDLQRFIEFIRDGSHNVFHRPVYSGPDRSRHIFKRHRDLRDRDALRLAIRAALINVQDKSRAGSNDFNAMDPGGKSILYWNRLDKSRRSVPCHYLVPQLAVAAKVLWSRDARVATEKHSSPLGIFSAERRAIHVLRSARKYDHELLNNFRQFRNRNGNTRNDYRVAVLFASRRSLPAEKCATENRLHDMNVGYSIEENFRRSKRFDYVRHHRLHEKLRDRMPAGSDTRSRQHSGAGAQFNSACRRTPQRHDAGLRGACARNPRHSSSRSLQKSRVNSARTNSKIIFKTLRTGVADAVVSAA